jgi:hypothetical protein
MSFASFGMPNGQWATQGFNGYSTYFSPNVQLEAPFIFRAGRAAAPESGARSAARRGEPDPRGPVDRSGRLPRYQSSGISYEREVKGSIVVSGRSCPSPGATACSRRQRPWT